MAQVSYGTITITDTNDIERIYMEYAQSDSNSAAPTTGWSEDIPAWEQGKYIWQRTVVKKEGIALSSDSYGDPVCLTGSTGSTGSPGATGRGVSSIVSTYCNYGTGTPAANYSGWSSTVPTYDSTKPNYWIKTVITYTSGTPATDTKIYQDNGITSATATAASAKTQAAAAEGKADSAVSTANTANTNASNALNIANGTNQHFWSLAEDTATTGGTLAAGQYITDVLQSSFKQNPNSSGNLLLRSDGVYLNLGLQTLASFKSNALTFYNSAGAELGKFGSEGLEMSGTLNIKGGGRIGQDSDNYWRFGDYLSYKDNSMAYLLGYGEASIQLGETGHWRLDKNRIHTGWYQLNDSTGGLLHFDTGADGNSTYYWDYGMHYPDKAGSGNNKFLYIRRSNNTTSTTLATMKGRIDDDTWWTYKFWVDGNGNVHAPGFYIGDSTTPIGGGAGTVAERLTQGYGSASQPIYFNSNGVPTNTTYQLNAAGAKGVDTSISAASTSTNLPTSQAVAAFVEGKGYITSYVDNKVQTSQANTTKIFLAGTSTAGTSTGTLNFDSNVYLTTTAGTLHATTFEGNLSGTASRATADGDGNTIKTTYLKLSGGNVTGAVTFGSSVSADELTVGDLVVNGAASFTNNAQFNTINGVAVGASPKFTDTVTTVTVTGNGNAVTSASASNGAVTLTKGATFLTSYTETDPIFKASAAYGISSTDISNWNSKTSNTGTVTSVAASGSGGISISGSPITTSGTIAIGLNLSTAINGLGEGTSNATRDDYIVAQYAGGGTTTTTYHRRKLSNIFAALNSSDITTALGYTPYNSTNPNGYITANHTSTYSLPIAKYNTLGGVKPAYSSTGAVSLTTAAATNTTTPTIAAKSTTSGRYYAVEVDKNGVLFVNVPWTNVNSSYLTSSSTLNWNNITQNKPTTASGYGITDAITNVSATSASGGSTTFTLTKSNGTTSSFDVVVYASAASQATDANYLTDGTTRYSVGSAKKPIYFDGGIPKASDGTEGTSTKPVYLSSGTITAGSTYAGGTAVTLNNASKAGSTASFYAPTTGGTTAQVLIGNGTTSAPVWTSISSLVPTNAGTADAFSSAATVALTGDTTGSASSTKGWSVATTTKYITNLGRPASADYLTPSYLSKVHFCLASSSMTTHKPPAGDGYITTYHWDNSGWAAQFYLRHNKDDPSPMVRGATNNSSNTSDWGEWKYILTEANYTNYTVTKTGSGASGTWGINITGNAANVTGTVAIANGGTGATTAASARANLGTWSLVSDSYNTLMPADGTTNGWVKIGTSNTSYGLLPSASGGAGSGHNYIGTSSWYWKYAYIDQIYGYLNGNISGSASSATSATNAYNLLAYSSNEATIGANSATAGASTNDTVWINYRDVMGGSTSNNATQITTYHFGNRKGGTTGVTVYAATFSGALSGNASTATKWASAQTVYVTLGTASTTTTIQGGSSSAQTIGVNGTLGVSNGGTGITSNPSMLTNLGSTTAASVFQTSPRPGITGTLGIANGGTGATSAASARTNLGLGSAATASTTTSIASGGTGLPTAGTVYTYVTNAISGASNTYVTIATDQTITASQKTFNGAIRWGTISKYGAAHYDSTLEAIVFSFA